VARRAVGSLSCDGDVGMWCCEGDLNGPSAGSVLVLEGKMGCTGIIRRENRSLEAGCVVCMVMGYVGGYTGGWSLLCGHSFFVVSG
jgi:hypothetical protein